MQMQQILRRLKQNRLSRSSRPIIYSVPIEIEWWQNHGSSKNPIGLPHPLPLYWTSRSAGWCRIHPFLSLHLPPRHEPVSDRIHLLPPDPSCLRPASGDIFPLRVQRSSGATRHIRAESLESHRAGDPSLRCDAPIWERRGHGLGRFHKAMAVEVGRHC